MFWTVLGPMRMVTTVAALTTVGFDIDYLPLRMTVLGLGLGTAVLRRWWMRTNRGDKAALIKALAQASQQPSGSLPEPRILPATPESPQAGR